SSYSASAISCKVLFASSCSLYLSSTSSAGVFFVEEPEEELERALSTALEYSSAAFFAASDTRPVSPRPRLSQKSVIASPAPPRTSDNVSPALDLPFPPRRI